MIFSKATDMILLRGWGEKFDMNDLKCVKKIQLNIRMILVLVIAAVFSVFTFSCTLLQHILCFEYGGVLLLII